MLIETRFLANFQQISRLIAVRSDSPFDYSKPIFVTALHSGSYLNCSFPIINCWDMLALWHQALCFAPTVLLSDLQIRDAPLAP
jgi:hypothetical protein